MSGLRRRRSIVVAIGVVGAALAAPGLPAAGAVGGTHLDCEFETHVAFTPGISPEVKEIHIKSTEPGPLRCTGTWAGQEVAGTGLGSFEGSAVGTCAGSTIDGALVIDHPLAGGDRFQVTVPIRAGRAGTVIHGVGVGPSMAASLVGTGTPDEGQNCLTVPVTGMTAEGRVLILG